MTTNQAQRIIQILTAKNIHFERGLSEDEVLEVEAKFDLKFPPDLKLFLQTGLPTSNSFVNWRLGLRSAGKADKINELLNWPLEGMLFDLKSNNFWIDNWGPKPGSYEDKVAIARKHYETYPRLIPIYSHRYIPGQPLESGNPVFSVYQMDIIYYGYDLATYFASEFHFVLPSGFRILEQPKRRIDFWSDCAE
jgi:hypothetical protein